MCFCTGTIFFEYREEWSMLHFCQCIVYPSTRTIEDLTLAAPNSLDEMLIYPICILYVLYTVYMYILYSIYYTVLYIYCIYLIYALLSNFMLHSVNLTVVLLITNKERSIKAHMKTLPSVFNVLNPFHFYFCDPCRNRHMASLLKMSLIKSVRSLFSNRKITKSCNRCFYNSQLSHQSGMKRTIQVAI